MRKVYTVVLFVHIYLAPLVVMGLMYGSIAVKLYRSVLENQNLRRQPPANGPVQAQRQQAGRQMISKKKIMVIKMLILVTLLFMLSWLPLWTLMMMTDYAKLNKNQLDLLSSYIFPFAHWLAFSNSSVNPIIYGYFNENFRRGFQAVYRAKPYCCSSPCCNQVCRANRRQEERPVQAASRREGRRVSGMRNRVHNTDKMMDRVNEGRDARAANPERSFFQQGVEMAVVHMKENQNEASAKEGSQQPSMCNAWENWTATHKKHIRDFCWKIMQNFYLQRLVGIIQREHPRTAVALWKNWVHSPLSQLPRQNQRTQWQQCEPWAHFN